jgi:alginate O-acetyltransferase complex protein AlgI
MLFNSYQFIFVFLPIVFCGFFGIAHFSRRWAALWMACVSLVFYGWENPRFVVILLTSIGFNYGMGYLIGQATTDKPSSNQAKTLLTIAVICNLGLLGYFKYTNFLINTVNQIIDTGWTLPQILLPIGISFFTFTQIAFLIDTYRGIAREYNFIHYLLFVTYFPHLIAGPVIHHKQMMPQFGAAQTYQVNAENLAVGITIFTMGLAKKVILADSFAEYASPIFDATKGGFQPGLFVAWIGAIAYTLQLYFDFSGYSDMAIGLSKLFGIDLPLNFNSPYKSWNIIEFWRRWHMTLSQFLRDYLYIPLGGNRLGPIRRYVNLIVTMLLGGLWHGANWTFVVWGGLHGLYLFINHGWHGLQKQREMPETETKFGRFVATLITFVAIVVAWVFFRAETFASATSILNGMIHFGDLSTIYTGTPSFESLFQGLNVPIDSYAYLLSLLGIGLGLVWIAPNTQTLVSKFSFHTDARRFLTIGFLSFWIFLMLAINASRSTSEFIYFNF